MTDRLENYETRNLSPEEQRSAHDALFGEAKLLGSDPRADKEALYKQELAKMARSLGVAKEKKKPREKPEREIVKDIRQALKSRGHMSIKFHGSQFFQAGIPDLLILSPGGKACFLEVKRPSGKMTKLQESLQSTIRALGFTCERVTSAAEALFFVEGPEWDKPCTTAENVNNFPRGQSGILARANPVTALNRPTHASG